MYQNQKDFSWLSPGVLKLDKQYVYAIFLLYAKLSDISYEPKAVLLGKRIYGTYGGWKMRWIIQFEQHLGTQR